MEIYSCGEVTEEIFSEIKKGRQAPTLAIIAVNAKGDDEVRIKKLQEEGQRYGINVDIFNYPGDVRKDQVISLIMQLNSTQFISGVYLFGNFPRYIDYQEVACHINKSKDVAGAIASSLNISYPGCLQLTEHRPVELDAINRICRHLGLPIREMYTAVVGDTARRAHFLAGGLADEGACVSIYHEGHQEYLLDGDLPCYDLLVLADRQKTIYPHMVDPITSGVCIFNLEPSFEIDDDNEYDITVVPYEEIQSVIRALILFNTAQAARWS